jgi:hypothetical protein
MRDRLRHQVQGRPGKWTSGLRKFRTADAVAASNSIEGFRVLSSGTKPAAETSSPRGENNHLPADERRGGWCVRGYAGAMLWFIRNMLPGSTRRLIRASRS